MPTPSRVLKAFVPETISVAGLTLEPFTLATFMLLESLDSPFVCEGKGSPTARDIARAVFLLTRPMEASQKLIAGRREAFDAEVLKFAGGIPAAQLAELGRKIGQHLDTAFATVPQAGGDPAEKKSSARSRRQTRASGGR
jgi:hypothetical protein